MFRAADDDSLISFAFNKGCDARLVGKSIDRNPYYCSAGDEHRQWERGWHHVNSYWGCLVEGRWEIMPLPPVEGAAKCPAEVTD